MTDAGWAERVVAQKYGHEDDGCIARLLQAEYARAVRTVKQAKKLSFRGLRDTDTNEWLDGYDAACNDILAALQRGRGKGGVK